jgi:hypothetical protein
MHKALILALLITVLVIGIFVTQDDAKAQGTGTLTQLQQWVATTSPSAGITQQVFGRPIVITGLSDGCLSLVSRVLTSSGSGCGSGFSTTSAAFFASLGLSWSTTSANAWVLASTTIPKSTGTGFTSGRMPYVTTGGFLTDALGMQFESASSTIVLRGPTGMGVITNNTPGLGISGASMNGVTAKYGDCLKFGSTDPQLTTLNPKYMAFICGYGTETYAADTDAGMGLEFFTTPNDGGAVPGIRSRMIIDQNGFGGFATTTSLTSLFTFGSTTDLQFRIGEQGQATSSQATTTTSFATTASSTNLFSSVLTVGGNTLITSGSNVGIGTTIPSTKLHVTSGANATTTVTVGSLGLTTSKSCVNMNRSDGSAASFFIDAAGVMIVETTYCK